MAQVLDASAGEVSLMGKYEMEILESATVQEETAIRLMVDRQLRKLGLQILIVPLAMVFHSRRGIEVAGREYRPLEGDVLYNCTCGARLPPKVAARCTGCGASVIVVVRNVEEDRDAVNTMIGGMKL